MGQLSVMFGQLVISTVMVMATVLLHGFSLLTLARVLRIEGSEEKVAHLSPTSARGVFFTFALVLGLFVIHGIEIWLYALLYLFGGALPDLHTAVYFSTITYATIGYDDEGLARSWQLVAAIEGINGILLMGWSTAFFVSLVARLSRR